MAPARTSCYYGAASCFDDDLLGTARAGRVRTTRPRSSPTRGASRPSFVVDGQLVSTIDQGLVDAYESVFKQGAVQGIGFYFSSGDDGDDLATWGYKHPRLPVRRPVGDRSSAARRSRSTRTTPGSSRPAGAPRSTTLKAKARRGAAGPVPWRRRRRLQPGLQAAVVPGRLRPAERQGPRGAGHRAWTPTRRTGMLVGRDAELRAPERLRPGRDSLRRVPHRRHEPRLAVAGGRPGRRPGRRPHRFANPRIYKLAQIGQRLPQLNPFYDVTPQGDVANVCADYANGYNADDGTVFCIRTFDEDSSFTTGRRCDDVTGVGTITPKYLDEIAWGW